MTSISGFSAAGKAVGIKGGDQLDAALVVAVEPATAAAVFTKNKAPAAPVQTSRLHLAASGGQVRAVLLTSGNANAATGESGLTVTRALCDAVAASLGCRSDEVLICQTGLIGVPFPVDDTLAAIGTLPQELGSDEEHGLAAATAIMTTDTFAKQVHVEAQGFEIGGMAKGAAMLAPDMATMLAVLTTDALLDPQDLATALSSAVAQSFNSMDVDGATSTNDTVILLSSGQAGPVDHGAFTVALTEACTYLAEAMVLDAEGATKAVRITVTGAMSDDEAHRGARKIATSQLVKCSLNGEDPYWGRILSEIATAGIDFDPDVSSISYGGIEVARAAVAIDHDTGAVTEHLAQRWVSIEVDLGLGSGRGAILTTDLGYGYIDENRTTS